MPPTGTTACDRCRRHLDTTDRQVIQPILQTGTPRARHTAPTAPSHYPDTAVTAGGRGERGKLVGKARFTRSLGYLPCAGLRTAVP